MNIYTSNTLIFLTLFGDTVREKKEQMYKKKKIYFVLYKDSSKVYLPNYILLKYIE